ncbi:MAG: hypothetical protein FWF76_02285 [Oscillospiraceae bacterium]|nr:hypothetical protein [Oscillospiraceae bacterium]
MNRTKSIKRKILSIIIVATIATSAITMTGCQRMNPFEPNQIELNQAYTFSANMQFREFNATANFERVSMNEWNVIFTEPFALAGLTKSYNAGKITSNFEGLSFSSLTTVNSNAVVTQIIEAFENAVAGEGREINAGGRSNEIIRVTSKTGVDANSYELVFDKKTLNPLSLEIPNKSISAEFSDVNVSQNVQVVIPNNSTETPVEDPFDELTEYERELMIIEIE